MLVPYIPLWPTLVAAQVAAPCKLVIAARPSALLCPPLLQGEDRLCLQHLAEYVRDEYKNKRGEQVGRK